MFGRGVSPRQRWLGTRRTRAIKRVGFGGSPYWLLPSFPLTTNGTRAKSHPRYGIWATRLRAKLQPPEYPKSWNRRKLADTARINHAKKQMTAIVIRRG